MSTDEYKSICKRQSHSCCMYICLNVGEAAEMGKAILGFFVLPTYCSPSKLTLYKRLCVRSLFRCKLLSSSPTQFTMDTKPPAKLLGGQCKIGEGNAKCQAMHRKCTCIFNTDLQGGIGTRTRSQTVCYVIGGRYISHQVCGKRALGL